MLRWQCNVVSVAVLLPAVVGRLSVEIPGSVERFVGSLGTNPSSLIDLAHEVDGGGDAALPAAKLLAKLANEPEASAMQGLANRFRMSVVRIHSMESVANWFRPFEPGHEQGAIGSGFAVTLAVNGRVPSSAVEDPVFITNAHVVRNAHTVKIQLPVVGQADFNAYVPLIYEEFDLALVRLEDPSAFLRFLKDQRSELQVLPIQDVPVFMGMEVAALGFPLGSSSLKLSRGVIAGTEQVDGRLCFQSTAPISPGSSGGPLFSLADPHSTEPQVIGANFAVSSDHMAQNANYVVPAVYIRQLLHEFSRRAHAATTSASALYPQGQSRGIGAGGQWPVHLFSAAVRRRQGSPRDAEKHSELRFAPINAIIVEANDALYNSKGCKGGVYLAKVSGKSALLTANPPVPAASFVVAVDGVLLDSFGMGRTKGFFGDPLPFENLMSLREHVEDPVELTVCKDGRISKHSVSMAWSHDYESGIKAVTETHFHPEALDFEIFADITIMQMTMNHVMTFLHEGGPPTMGRWLLPENTRRKRLVIVDVRGGTYASRVLSPGMVLEKLNGQPVSTLKDFRKSFEPYDAVWRLETERGVVYETDFKQAVVQQLEEVNSGPSNSYLNTTAFADAVSRHVISNRRQTTPEKVAELVGIGSVYAGGVDADHANAHVLIVTPAAARTESATPAVDEGPSLLSDVRTTSRDSRAGPSEVSLRPRNGLARSLVNRAV